ncbi:MAG: tRNA pseudouridine(54/55) synthase Pus10 [Methanomicrobiales archaeon]|nr:tRNA pseudouridine(54/55) synthase Pus10 [Methanomicrobiales archaeon]
MAMMELVGKIMDYGEICDHCLGRLFGKRGHGLTNDERGRALRIAHTMERNIPYSPAGDGCCICRGLFSTLDEWVERTIQALEGFEYRTFIIGTRVPPMLAENEEMIWSDLHLSDAEPLNAEVNREVGKRLERRTGKKAKMDRPDVVAILDIPRGCVEVQVNPVFIRGRYVKLERGIPQTRWPCRECGGSGCPRCHQTGKMYPDSVEELIGRHVKACFSAEDAILHGGGREDIDALMLGEGRPFVMEVVKPRIRIRDLSTLQEEINRAEAGRISVVLTGYAERADVREVKAERMMKRYRVTVEIEGPISPGEIKRAISSLRGATIRQRTPMRVSHRRADLIRERRVLGIVLVEGGQNRCILEILGEAGLYIKELITGDTGRTRPSLSELLGRQCNVIELDVVEVLRSLEGSVIANNKKV